MKSSSCLVLIIAAVLISWAGGVWQADAASTWTNPYWGGKWNNPTSSLLQTMIMNRAMQKATVKGNKQRSSGASVESGFRNEPSARYHQSLVTFRPVAARLMTRQTAEAFAGNSGNRDALEQVFIQLLDIFSKDAARDGEQNNLARAAAFFVVANYTVISGTMPTEAQATAYQREVAASMIQMQDFRAMSDRRKQELYETFVIYGMFAVTGYKQGLDEGNRQQVNQFREFARHNIKTVLGVPAYKLRFNNSGLVIEN